MKAIITLLALLTLNFATAQDKNVKTSMEVDGVCKMCKERIEKAAIRTKGVRSAVWSIETHQLSLIYDGRKTDVETISANIAEVGHDTKSMKATEEAYLSVHDCCRYRDENVQLEHETDHKN